jgi:hypothetical protein
MPTIYCRCAHLDGEHFDEVGACAKCQCSVFRKVMVNGPFPETVDSAGRTWLFWPYMALRRIGIVTLTGRGYTPAEAIEDLHDDMEHNPNGY